MPYKNSRNSREDKSLKNNRFESGSKNERPRRTNSGTPKKFEGGRKAAGDDRRRGAGFSSGDDRRFDKGRSAGRDERGAFGDQARSARPYREAGERRSEGDRKEGSYGKPFRKPGFSSDRRSSSEGRERGSFGSSSERKPFSEGRERKSFGEGRERKPFGEGRERKPFGESRDRGEYRPNRKDSRSDYGGRPRRDEGGFEKRPYQSDRKDSRRDFQGGRSDRRPAGRRKYEDGENRQWTSEEHFDQPATLRGRKGSENKESSELIRLNRYIANAGICSRRKADELIEAGVITVNGEAVSELGYKVNPAKDEIRYNGELLKREKMVYVLLNKPKDYITTTDDPQERKTVMQLVEKASRERIYPVGRLDRNTTGLLLMTNDGDLAEKLSHPRNNVTKIYQVELSKSLSQGDLNKIGFGIELEDGFIKPDVVSYVQGGSKREIGIQIHSGKNRIVRRIFEHLGYEVVKLDRVVYANLTKKDLPRGRWRYLDEKEIIQLKHFVK